jgi:ABC-2 type transport system permease protein
MAARATAASRRDPVRVVRIYGLLLRQELKTLLAYRGDAALLVFSTLVSQALPLIVLLLILRHVPVLAGWSAWQALVLYAFIPLSEGFASLLSEGVWQLSWQIFSGEFDRYLVRPFPVLLQVFGGGLSAAGFTNLLGGTALMAAGLIHERDGVPIAHLAVFPIILAAAVAIRLSLNVIGNCAGFWFVSQWPMPAYTIYGLADLAKYPLEIYPRVMRIVLASALPFAFVSYYPAVYLLGRSGPHGYVIPLACVGVALAAVGVAVGVFQRGVRRYESTGS